MKSNEFDERQKEALLNMGKLILRSVGSGGGRLMQPTGLLGEPMVKQLRELFVDMNTAMDGYTGRQIAAQEAQHSTKGNSPQKLMSKKDGEKALPKIQALFAGDGTIQKIWFGSGYFVFDLKMIDTKPFYTDKGCFNGTKYLQAADANQRRHSRRIRVKLRENGFGHVTKTVLQ